MHGLIDVIFHTHQAKRPELGINLELGDSFHRLLLGEPVADQLRDTPELEPVPARETQKIVAACHRAVLIENLDDGRRRFQAGQPDQVAAGFRMTGPCQDTAGLRHERKDMAGLAQVLGLRVWSDGCANRARPIMS